jgi:ComF family protein
MNLFNRARFTNIQQDCVLCDAAEADVVCAPCRASLPCAATYCPSCAAPNHVAICGACLRDKPQFDATLAAYQYQFPLDRLVQSFKFSANLALVDFFSDALARQVKHSGMLMPDMIVALPLANKRLASRGFNQSALIADVVGRLLNIKVAHSAMLRIRETPPQAGLSRALRLKNIKGAFDCAGNVDGKHIAVIDDVMTTGATLSEAAKVLKRAGAIKVDAWVLARAVFDEARP